MSINRKILAKTRGCQDGSYLQGTLCTINCDHRETCKNRRIKLMIYSHVLEIKPNLKKHTLNRTPTISIPAISIFSDEYINDLIESD